MAGVLCSMVGASFVTAVAEVIRLKKSVLALGNAQVDTAQSKFGGASALFDGTGDYLIVANDSSFAYGTGDFTIEFWYRPSSFPNAFNILWDQRPNGTQTTQPTIYVNSSGTLYYYTNGGNRITAGSNLSTNTWYHVAVSRSGTSTKMFINGTQTGSTYTDSTNYTSSSGGIYIFTDQYSGPANYPVGHLDEVRISNTARYTATFTPSTTPFVNDASTLLLLHMDGTDATTFFEDDNGIGRTQKGVQAFGNAQIDTAQSKFGGSSALFDGTGDYLQSGEAIIPTTGDFTIECWVRPAATGVRYDLIGNNETSIGRCIMNTTTGNQFQFFIGDSVLGNLLITGTSTYSANTWYHVAVSRNNNDFRLFVNGTVESSSLNAANYTLANKALNVGWRPGATNYHNGHIDEIRISNSARYTANFTAPTAPFVNDANTLLLLHMDGTDASTVFRDDNGVRSPKGIRALNNAQIDTAQSQFGGSSALFDGTGDFLVVEPSTDFQYNSSSTFTIECWLRTTAVNNTSHLFATYSTSSPFNGWALRVNDVNSCLSFWDGVSWRVFNTNSLTTNTWYHAAIVSSAGSVKMYMNGVEQTTTFSLTSSVNNTANNLYIGTRIDGNNGFTGHLDEIRISNTARYTANFTPSTTPFQNDANTVLLLHCDGTDDSTVFIDDNGVTATHEYS